MCQRFKSTFLLLVSLLPSYSIAKVKAKVCKKRNITRRVQRSPENSRFKVLRNLISKGIREQTVSELEHNYALHLKVSDLELCIKYLETLIPKLIDFAKIRTYRLKLADLYFECRRFEKAGSLYSDYYDAYPGHVAAEYALWRATLAQREQLGACDQDCAASKAVMELGQKYLENKAFQQYRSEINAIVQLCDRELFNGEIVVFEHYFRQGFLAAAQRRLDYMRQASTKLLGEQPNLGILQTFLDRAKAGRSPVKVLRERDLVELVWGKSSTQKSENFISNFSRTFKRRKPQSYVEHF